MARRLLPLTVLVLMLALPAAHAAPPTVGYAFTGNPADRAASVAVGASHTYHLTLTLSPATGDSTVDLVVGFTDFTAVPSYSDAIAPPSDVAIRAASADAYASLGIVSGYDRNQTRLALPGGEYQVKVTSTIEPGTPAGSHRSFLGFTARDPGARTSTATASYPFTFTVVPPPNRAPVASFTHSVSGLTLHVDAGAASDPDGDNLAFAWSFGDDGTATGRTASHTYGSAGTYTVRLQASDGRGLSDEHSTTVTVGSVGGGNGGGGNGGGSGDGGSALPFDADGDTYTDDVETASGSDPNNRQSIPPDRDGDGRANEADNCPAASNADQADKDTDRLGDVCDQNDDDGPTGDPDGDGKASNADNCPGAANADQLDLDGDGRGNACDTDMDGDGALNEADAFPLDPTEKSDHDGDLVGDNADTDDDNDLLKDADEAADGSDPRDRHDPPWIASSAAALRVGGANLVAWTVPADERVQRFLVWREASPYVLLDSVAATGADRYQFTDGDAPARARYHIQAQLVGTTALLFSAADDRATNWVTAAGPAAEECTSIARDGDGVKDGAELLGQPASLPNLLDSDGDGRSDGEERRQGTDPMAPDAATVEPKEGGGLPGWLWPTLIIAGAIVVAALILRKRQAPPQ